MTGLASRAWQVARGVRSNLRLGRFGDRALAMRLGAALRGWQLQEALTLKRFVHEFAVDCIFDVGANVGQYARMLRADCDYRGLILSFEPNPHDFARLAETAAGDRNWHCLPMALTDRDATLTFNIMAYSQFSSLLPPDPGQDAHFDGYNRIAEQVEVAGRRLDGLYPALQREYGFKRPFLKMDTQGHDLAVLHGAAGVTGQLLGLQTELSFRSLYQGSTGYRAMLDHCDAIGFAPCAIFQNNGGHFPLLYEVDAILVRKDLSGG